MISLLFGRDNTEQQEQHNSDIDNGTDLIYSLQALHNMASFTDIDTINQALLQGGYVLHYMQKQGITNYKYMGKVYRICPVFNLLAISD